MRSIRKTAGKKAAPRGKKAAPKRQTKRDTKNAAKRTTKAATKRNPKRSAPKSIRKTVSKRKTATRNRKMSFARTWERRIEGWRRFILRHSYLKGYAAMAAVTLAIYAVWASGFIATTGSYITERTQAAALAAGFTVQRVTLEGHEETSPVDVMAALDLEIGTPIFEIDLAELRARVETLEWVERATVMRALPGRVHVIIEEREPFALWQIEQIWRVVSRDGQVITSAEVNRHDHLPQVVGIGASEHAVEILAAMAQVPDLASRVRSAVRVSDRRWDLHFDSGVVVQLPEQNLEAALASLSAYESEHRLLARAISTVDLRLDDRIVIRPRSDSPSTSPMLALPSAAERGA